MIITWFDMQFYRSIDFSVILNTKFETSSNLTANNVYNKPISIRGTVRNYLLYEL